MAWETRLPSIRENFRALNKRADVFAPRMAALLAFVVLIIASIALCVPVVAQESGPMAGAPSQHDGPAGMPPPPAPAPSRQAMAAAQTPASPAPAKQADTAISKESPSVPVDQIIQTFAQHEAEFKTERDNFTYTQEFVIQTIDDDSQPDGEYRMTSDIGFTQDGKRFENITFAPPPTLVRISLSEQDLDDLRNIQPFVLTSVDLPKYDVTYVGRQQIDQLGTYVFDVAPKKIEKNQRYFQGRIWVEDKDLEIVKTDGKAVPDIRKGGTENVFPRFETYRENIEGHYWFPTYTHSDDFLKFTTGAVHIRMTVRYTEYKRFRVTSRVLPGTTTPVNKP
jgi:hypothetical protein